MTRARYIETELEQIDTSMVKVEVATKGLQDALKRVGGRMDGQDTVKPNTNRLHHTSTKLYKQRERRQWAGTNS